MHDIRTDRRIDELTSGLSLATQEELSAIAQLLFQPKFNPLDYLYTPQLDDICRQPCSVQRQLMADRFRYLAADGLTVLQKRSHQLSYRQVLIQVAKFLHLAEAHASSASSDTSSKAIKLSTVELESDIFLALLDKTWQQLDARTQRQVTVELRRSIGATQAFAELPAVLQKNPMALLAKGGSAITVSALLRPWLLSQIARQFAIQLARYQVAKQTLVRGGLTVAAQVKTRAAATMASRGMAITTARYGVTRGLFAFLGPALWTWFLADLGWRAIATNYGRIIPVIFAVAQIRLTRSLDCRLYS